MLKKQDEAIWECLERIMKTLVICATVCFCVYIISNNKVKTARSNGHQKTEGQYV